MPLMVQATDPIIPIAQQEQLQQDRDTQRERSLRLDEERVETVASEPALIDVPSDQNGASFYIKQILLYLLILFLYLPLLILLLNDNAHIILLMALYQ